MTVTLVLSMIFDVRKDLIVQDTMSEGAGTAAGALAYCKELAQASLLVDLATEYPLHRVCG